jgi:hypothetical protein
MGISIVDVMSLWGLHTVASAVGRRRGAIGGFGRHFADVQVIAVLKMISVRQSHMVGKRMTRLLAVLAMFFVGVTPALIYPTVIHSLLQGRHVRVSCIVARHACIFFDLKSREYAWKPMLFKEYRRVSS